MYPTGIIGPHRAAHRVAGAALRVAVIVAVVLAALLFVDIRRPDLLASAYQVLTG